MNRRQLLGAGIAAAVGSWLPWRSRPVRPLPSVLNPHDLFVPAEYCGDYRLLTRNAIIATIVHRDFTDDEANGSHSRFLSFGPMAQAAA
jgi:hypothetical protein